MAVIGNISYLKGEGIKIKDEDLRAFYHQRVEDARILRVEVRGSNEENEESRWRPN